MHKQSFPSLMKSVGFRCSPEKYPVLCCSRSTLKQLSPTLVAWVCGKKNKLFTKTIMAATIDGVVRDNTVSDATTASE